MEKQIIGLAVRFAQPILPYIWSISHKSPHKVIVTVKSLFISPVSTVSLSKISQNRNSESITTKNQGFPPVHKLIIPQAAVAAARAAIINFLMSAKLIYRF